MALLLEMTKSFGLKPPKKSSLRQAPGMKSFRPNSWSFAKSTATETKTWLYNRQVSGTLNNRWCYLPVTRQGYSQLCQDYHRELFWFFSFWHYYAYSCWWHRYISSALLITCKLLSTTNSNTYVLLFMVMLALLFLSLHPFTYHNFLPLPWLPPRLVSLSILYISSLPACLSVLAKVFVV